MEEKNKQTKQSQTNSIILAMDTLSILIDEAYIICTSQADSVGIIPSFIDNTNSINLFDGLKSNDPSRAVLSITDAHDAFTKVSKRSRP